MVNKKIVFLGSLALPFLVAPDIYAAGLAVSPFTLFDPEGLSFLSGNSADGTTATIDQVRGDVVSDGAGGFFGGNAVRPRVTSNFTTADISQVGQTVQVDFDMVLNNAFLDDTRGGLHFSLFDSVAGSELLGLIHLGTNAGRTDFVKFRIDNDTSPENLGVGGNSRGGQALAPGGITLRDTGINHSFSMFITRISPTEHSFNLSWQNAGGISSYSFASYNETIGVIDGEANPATSDIWNGGMINQFDGFSIMLHDDDPFNTDGNPATFDAGTFVISNFTVSGTAIPEPSSSLLAGLAGIGLALRRRR